MVVLSMVLASESARAEGAQDSAAYRKLLDQAVAEYQAGNYLEARTLFARAHEQQPNARTFRGLGIVSFELREYADSVSYLSEALSSQERPLQGAMRSEAAELLARARGFVAQLDLDVQPPDSTVSIDGADPRPVRKQLLVNVGAHEFAFAAPGHPSVHRSLKVVGGEQLHWTVSLKDGTSAESANEHTVPSAQLARREDVSAVRARRTKVALLSSTLSLGVLTGVALGMRESKARELQQHCMVATPHCSSVEDGGKSWRAVAIASGAAAAVLLGLTVAWYWRDHRLQRERSLSAACALGIVSPGFSCEARF